MVNLLFPWFYSKYVYNFYTYISFPEAFLKSMDVNQEIYRI